MIQYLDKSNVYTRQLITFGESGYQYVVACEEEEMEPEYIGCKTLKIAIATAEKLEKQLDCRHIVFEIVRDADGLWTTDYKNIL